MKKLKLGATILNAKTFSLPVQKQLLEEVQYSLSCRQILVIDAPLIDSSINNVPEECLETDVSPILNINYLSKCEQDEKTIKNKLQYKGGIIGNLPRLFVSIPTSYPQINKFVNVHFLLNTASPRTTLTHRALCAIHQRPFSTQIVFPRQMYQIGGRKIAIHLSNPNPTDPNPSHAFHSVNILGMDFLTKYQDFNIKVKTKSYEFYLSLFN